MPSARNPSTSSTNQGKREEGSNNLIECTGPGVDGNGCVIWTNVWVPTQIPKNIFARPFLCGFCAFEGLNKASRCTTEDLAPIIEANSIEQYVRRENVRIFGVQEEPGEDVYAKVVSVAEEAGVQITTNDVSTCHRLPGKGSGPKPLIAKFVRRDTKYQLMKNKRNLKNTNVFVNDDLAPIRAKVTRELRKRDDVARVHTVNEKIIVFMQDNEKLVFENLYKLQKWDKELLASACESVKKFIWNLGISDAFCSFDFLTFAWALLKLCGDIEQNPGPVISYDNFSKLSDKNK